MLRKRKAGILEDWLDLHRELEIGFRRNQPYSTRILQEVTIPCRRGGEARVLLWRG